MTFSWAQGIWVRGPPRPNNEVSSDRPDKNVTMQPSPITYWPINFLFWLFIQLIACPVRHHTNGGDFFKIIFNAFFGSQSKTAQNLSTGSLLLQEI